MKHHDVVGTLLILLFIRLPYAWEGPCWVTYLDLEGPWMPQLKNLELHFLADSECAECAEMAHRLGHALCVAVTGPFTPGSLTRHFSSPLRSPPGP